MMQKCESQERSHATLISYPDAAEQLGISISAVRRLIAAGRLSVMRIPGAHPRLLREEIGRLAAASLVPARVPPAD